MPGWASTHMNESPLEVSMPSQDNGSAGNDDLKARMREALERKQRNHDHPDPHVAHPDHDRGHAESHGPAGGPKMHRRKAGGGGA